MGPIPRFGIIGAAIAMLTYYTFGVIGMVAHLQSARSPVHLTLCGLRLQRQLFYRILKVASLSSVQILLTSVAPLNSLHMSKRLCLRRAAIST